MRESLINAKNAADNLVQKLDIIKQEKNDPCLDLFLEQTQLKAKAIYLLLISKMTQIVSS